MTSAPSCGLPRRVALVATFPVRTRAEIDEGADPPLFRHCARPDTWTHGTSSDRRFNDFDATLAGDLRQAGPHFVAELGPAGTLRELPQQLHRLTACFEGHPVTLAVAAGEIGVTPVGYGTVRLVYDVSPGGDPGPELADLSLSSSVEDAIDGMVQRVVCDLEVDEAAGRSAVAVRVSATPCLWAHTIYLFDEPQIPGNADLAPVADEQRPDLALPRGVVRPGLGSSLVTAGNESAFDLTVRVLSLVSAYYAALADVDRRVFRRLVEWRESASHRPEPVVLTDRLFEEVSVFQAVLQTLDLHLAASTALEVRIWGAITRVWRIDQQMVALTSKLTALRTFQERESERVGLARTDRLTAVALAFTVLSFLGVMVDVVQFGQDKPLVPPDWARTVLSLLFMLAVALAFALGVRRRR